MSILKLLVISLILNVILIAILINDDKAEQFSAETPLKEDQQIIDSYSGTPITDVEDLETVPEETKVYKHVMTTFFWVGEEASEDNNFISNYGSIWDNEWVDNFGGVDTPYDRCGYKPCSFNPNENSFYFALPYTDIDDNNKRKGSSTNIPWYSETDNGETILKNKWIEIVYRTETCYAQWEDVGPIETDDFEYVFGDAHPKNEFDIKAGLDVSPSVKDCLELPDNDIAAWRFIDEKDVPEGPWKDTVTY